MASTGDAGWVLVFDGDCGFCTSAARWLVSRGPASATSWQDLEATLTADEITRAQRAAGWKASGRIEAWGSEAIAAALRARGGPARLAGRVLALPGVRAAAVVVYRWVASNRHRLPGSDGTCAIPDVHSSKHNMHAGVLAILGYLVVFLAFILQFQLWADSGREPFPQIQMPTFAGVPEATGAITSTEVRLSVHYADGTTERVTPDQIQPFNAINPASAVYVVFQSEERTNQTEVAAWFRHRLQVHRPGSDPVSLHVRWLDVSYDPTTKAKTITDVADEFTVDLKGADS